MQSKLEMSNLISVNNLGLSVCGKEILNDINFSIKKGEVVALIGPNGSGKSSFLKTIMGFDNYSTHSGDILLNNESILGLPINERAKKGLGIMHQNPARIRGVKLIDLLQSIHYNLDDIEWYAKELKVEHLLDREINMNLSGGEMKRTELLQLFVQENELLLLDEPDSGVDSGNLRIMGLALNSYLKRTGKSALIITHTGGILKYLDVTRFLMLKNQTIREINQNDAGFD